MGGLGDELRLTLELTAQAFGEMVQGTYQRAQFTLHFDQRQGPQVVGLTLFHRTAQALQRPQRSAHRKPHQHQCAERQHAQTQQGIGHQAAGHAHPRLFGFGHADLGHAVHVRFGDGLEQAHYTHVLTQVARVVEARQGRVIIGARRTRWWRREVFVTGDQALMNVIDLVVDTSGAVVGKGIQGHIGHVGAEGAVTLGQARGNGSRGSQQGAVVGGVGRFATIPVGTQTAGQHQHHQQQGQVPQQPPAQADAVTHRDAQAGSRAP
ncbi:hypothetical protein D3C78_1175540 [compost metagenome]